MVGGLPEGRLLPLLVQGRGLKGRSLDPRCAMLILTGVCVSPPGSTSRDVLGDVAVSGTKPHSVNG